jgi:60 kDa SS-A/Ro ribonucleoprotein
MILKKEVAEMKRSGYSFYTGQKNVPISKPLPGREADMVKNLAGGYAFKADDKVALRRWMLTGSESNAFYQSRDELTNKNVTLLAGMVKTNPQIVADEIVYASDHGINNHAPILALVYLSTGDETAKNLFKAIFNKVVRTASHLYEFMEYTKGLRGFGRVIHSAVESWIASREVKNLEYQFLKYQNRYEWTGRDLLRKIKPVPRDELEGNLFAWMADKPKGLETLPLISVYERLKKGGLTSKEVVALINEFNLGHEMIPANIVRDREIWEAMFVKMPVTATLRNLANLTNKGIFTNLDNLKILEGKFTKENLVRGRVHPIAIASAYKIYSGGGMLGRTQLTWVPHPVVDDILEKAIEDAFVSMEPTGKVFYHAVDVSGSMSMKILESLWMTPLEIASIMALATLKAEKYYNIVAFSKAPAIEFPGLRKTTSFKDIITNAHVKSIPQNYVGSLTDMGSAIQYATENKIKADVMVIWTDGQTWRGTHPTVALKEYRAKVNPEAKAVYAILVPYGDAITLTDPNDAKSYDIAGFTSESPKLIQMIANGEL